MHPPARAGQTIAQGRYRLVRQIGRGSFGDVYLAEQRGRDGRGQQAAVLKLLHPKWAQVAQVVERFRRESLVTMMVNHPHVACVFEHGQLEDGVPFIAMEYLPGRSLREDLVRGGRMAPARAFAIMVPICDALSAAHRAGVVHRDLKPENIQLVERGGNPDYPVVLDFGVAKFLDAAERLTMTGAVLGTPTYMSPEQFRGETNLGPPADVYALGVLVFELFTGQPPFAGRSFAELAMAHTSQPPPPLPGVPAALAAVVARCLDKEPARRPQADALCRALRAAAGLKASADPHFAKVAQATLVVPDLAMATVVSEGVIRSERETRRRQRLLVTVLGGILLVLLASFVSALYSISSCSGASEQIYHVSCRGPDGPPRLPGPARRGDLARLRRS